MASAPLDPALRLLETMLWEPGRGVVLWDGHMARLQRSAEALGWPAALPDAADLAAAVASACAQAAAPRRVRVTVGQLGPADVTVEAAELQPLAAAGSPLRVVVAAEHPVAPDTPLLRHKTTHRAVYDAARARHGVGQPGGPADVVLVNARGEVTESSIANVLVDLSGTGDWVTPPASCGLLPGVLRAHLLATGQVREAVVPVALFRELVTNGHRVRLCNAVRGVYDVTVEVGPS